MKFVIQVKSKTSEFVQEIQGSRCVIGSGAPAHLVIPGWKVQKQHAELFVSNEQVYLRDLSSMFGTFIDGKKVATFGPLKKNLLIQIGGHDLSVEWFRNSKLNSALSGESASEVESIIRQQIDEIRLTKPSPMPGDTVKVGSNNTVGFTPLAQSAAAVQPMPPNSPTGTDGVKRNIDAVQQEAGGFIKPHKVAPEVEGLNRQSSKAKGVDARPVMVDETRLALRRSLQDKLIASFDLRRIDIHKMSDENLREHAESALKLILKSENLSPDIDKEALIAEVRDEAIGLGLLEPLLADPSVTEIMVNTFDEIFVERDGRLSRLPLAFSSSSSVMGIIERIVAPVGRRIDESSPLVDARLKDGSRFNAIIPPLALKGPSLTIRKFSTKKLNGEDLIRFGSASASMVKFLEIAVLHKKNIIVSGGTGSGKTTLLNILSNFIPNNERIVTIEDAAELRLHHEHLVSLEARPANAEGKGAVAIRDLVKNSLRMRPDRIVVGECRGGEALDMLQAMNTGHDGSLTTAHANTPRDMLARLEVMVLMSGMDLPITAIREQVVSAVDIVVQQTRFACGTRKISRISEVTGIESGRIQLQDLFEFVETGFTAERKVDGHFSGCGAIPEFYEAMQASGIDLDIGIFEKVA